MINPYMTLKTFYLSYKLLMVESSKLTSPILHCPSNIPISPSCRNVPLPGRLSETKFSNFPSLLNIKFSIYTFKLSIYIFKFSKMKFILSYKLSTLMYDFFNSVFTSSTSPHYLSILSQELFSS